MKKQELEALFQRGEDVPDLGPIEKYLHALATEQHLPDVALTMCTVRIEEAAPALRAILARAADGDPLSEDEATLAFRGLHVLGGARDHLAWPHLLRLLRRPNDEIEHLLGDCVTETLPRIAAGVFDGDVDALFGAIGDRSIDEFIRGSLLRAATFLAWESRIDRDRMQQFLDRFYQERLAPDQDQAWIGWLEAIALLGLRALAPLVEHAWDEGCIPEEVLERRDFRQDLAEAERAPDDVGRFKRANLGYIDDVLEALAWTDYTDDVADLDAWEPPWTETLPLAAAPVTNPWRHVGRNDPCPCGSGRKAKKCCLAK
jgi:hypothetical protein